MSSKKNELGGRLRAIREATGLSQAAFAEMMGVHRRSQINYELGKRTPALNYFEAMQKAGIDISDLLDWPNETAKDLKAMAYFHLLSTAVSLLGIKEDKLQSALREAYQIAIESIVIKGGEPSFDRVKLDKGMIKLATKLLQDQGFID